MAITVTPGDWDAIERVMGSDFKRRRSKLIQVIAKVTEDQSRSGGKFIMADDEPYYLDGVDKRPYKIDVRDTKFLTLLAFRYGLERSEPITKSLISMLDAMARTRGARAEVHRFAWFDRVSKVLYLSRYDGTCWRLDGKTFDVVSNGEGVLFLDDDDGEACDGVDPTATISGLAPEGKLLETLVGDLSWRASGQEGTGAALTPEVQRALLGTWIHAVAFATMLATKPILLLEGSKGSGKTVAVQRIQLALTGQTFPLIIGEKEEDFGVQLLRSPIACLDNVDSNKPWLRDAMCTYTSSGGTRKRKRYSDTDQVNVRPQTMMAVTSRNPATFRRDDVADRCLVLRLDRRPGSSFEGSWIFDTVRESRPKMYSEWLWRLNRVVAELRAMPRVAYPHRLADFAHLSHAVGKASLNINVEGVNACLAAAEVERELLTLDADPLIVALDAWMPIGKGHDVTAAQLFERLSKHASDAGVKFYESSRALATRLGNIGPAIEHRYGVTIERSPAHAGVFRYRFAPLAK